MPVFRLTDEIIFPPPELADEDGLIAVGGDLSQERLLYAYSLGIFPWYSQDSPILWWSPDPRLVLFPGDLKVSRSLRQTIRKSVYHISMDEAFQDVITACATVHRSRDGDTWIVEAMQDAYTVLHRSGFAHSVEAWHKGRLAGGLYGVSIGSAFFGESMFAQKSDASKVAFVALVRQLMRWNFSIIDCQITTAHLKSFGAREIARSEFLNILHSALTAPTRKGRWMLED